MYIADKTSLIEVRTGEGQNRKDYVCCPFTHENPLESCFVKPDYIGRFEVRPIEDWKETDFMPTEDVVYVALYRTQKEETYIKTSWDIVPFKDRPKTKAKPKAKPKATPTPTPTPKPKAKKESKYGFVEFLADFFAEWTKRRALR